jgi:hypothetical protein
MQQCGGGAARQLFRPFINAREPRRPVRFGIRRACELARIPNSTSAFSRVCSAAIIMRNLAS